MFIALRNYNFRLFWSAQIISLIGSWMQTVGLSWLVWVVTGRADQLGLVTMLQFLPILVFALVGGVVADRVSKRKFLLFTQSVALIQALILGVLTHHSDIKLPQIYVLAFIGGLNSAFDNPARQAFVVEMVGREDLPNAVALNSGLFNAARIVGPAIGGLIIGNGTLPRLAWTFYLNSASYVPALLALSLMDPSRFRAIPKAPRGRMAAQVIEAWRYCFSLPATTLIIVMMGVIGTFGYNFAVSLPLLATYLHSGARGFGILSACMGAGSLVGAIYLARRSYFTRRLLLTGAGCFVVFLSLVSVSHWFLLTCALLVGTGMASLLCNASGNTLLQMATPDELRGRVMSIFFLLLAGSTPIGGYITGIVAQHYRILVTLRLEAAVVGLGAIWAIYYYSTRHLAWGDLRARAVSRKRKETADENHPATATSKRR